MYDQILERFTSEDATEQEIIRLNPDKTPTLQSNAIAASVRYVFVKRNITLDGIFVRREVPLTLVVDGSIRFASNVQIKGLVQIISTEPISIPANIVIDQVIFYNRTGIELQPSANAIAQCISPVITMRNSSRLSYPSLILSTSSQKAKVSRILLEVGTRVEGTLVALYPVRQNDPSVVVHSGATVVGVLYSEGTVTFDGVMHGSLMVSDFYFYESPTTYLGWLRTGRIDRALLPSSFLLPSFFTENPQSGVLDWL
jgi:cytoskeletal protein CcmA (bactofilin family)